MQRRREAAALNAGFWVIVPERALIIRDPIFGSRAHEGTKPHLTWEFSTLTGSESGSSRGALSRTTFTVWVGATLYDGDSSSPTVSVTSNAATRSRRLPVDAYRPHTDRSLAVEPTPIIVATGARRVRTRRAGDRASQTETLF